MKSLIVAPVLALAIAGCQNTVTSMNTHPVLVELDTALGNIEIQVFTDKAPITSRAFLGFVDDGTFSEYGTFYRTVRSRENDTGHPVIDVIQGGWQNPSRTLPGIEHESTDRTGLKHLDGTVSLGRLKFAQATGALFFICIGDQPALDVGTERIADHQGFSAFGRVTRGMEVVRRIHALPADGEADNPLLKGQMLTSPVRIVKAFRKK